MKEQFWPRKIIAGPSVYPVGKRSDVTIISLTGRDFFTDGDRYQIFVYPMASGRSVGEDNPDATVTAKDGAICFSYIFETEEEYRIRFRKEGKDYPWSLFWPVECYVYALNEDWFGLRPLKGDTHVHCNRSDGKDDPDETAANYRRLGFDYLALTDHDRIYAAGEVRRAFKSVPIDLTLIDGEELEMPGSPFHIVNLGGKTSVGRIYRFELERYRAEIRETEEAFKDAGPMKYYLARAKWASDRIHESGGAAVLVHPFWIHGDTYNHDIPTFVKLLSSGWFDIYEVADDMQTHGNNLGNAFYSDIAAEGPILPVIGSSDAHNTLDNPSFNCVYSVVLAEDNTQKSIINAMLASRSAAVERAPKQGFEWNYHVTASLRMTMYVRFLADNYFSRTEELFAPEGYLMREYSQGVAGAAEALEALHGRGDHFYRFFFGRDNEPYYQTARSRELYSTFSRAISTDSRQVEPANIDKTFS